MSHACPPCWSTLPSFAVNLVLDSLPDAHDVAAAQATCRAFDLQQRNQSISLTIEGGHRFGDGDLKAFAAQWRRRSTTIKQAIAVMQSSPMQNQHPITSLQLSVQLSCNKLGVPMPSGAGTDPEARSTARQLLAALPPTVVRLQLSEVFTSLPELGEVLSTLRCLRHLKLEVSPASLALLARADNLQSLTRLQSLALTSPHPLCLIQTGMCLKDRFSTSRPLNDLACLPSLPPCLHTLSLGNLPLGRELTSMLLTPRRAMLTDLTLDGCHVDLRTTPFPWHGLQRFTARQATVGATHVQLVALAACPTLHVVDLCDARLYDLVACGVEYLGFSFLRWQWTSSMLHHADLRLHCDSSKAPWATYCNGPLGELFGRCYSPLTPRTVISMPPTVHTCAIQTCAIETAAQNDTPDNHNAQQQHQRQHQHQQTSTNIHYRGTLRHFKSNNMITNPAVTTVSLRLGASQVQPLLHSMPHIRHAHLTADHGDTHLDMPSTSDAGRTLQSLSLQGFVLGRVDLRAYEELQSLSVSVPHTQHIQRAYSAHSAAGSSSSSDEAYSSEDEGAHCPQLRPLPEDQPCVLLPINLQALALKGGVPMLLSEVLPGPQGCGMAYTPVGGEDTRVLWDLRGLRGLRRLAVHDGERRLGTCVKLPYGVETLGLGDAWGPSAIEEWTARLQNLRALRLCPVDSPRGLRETLSRLPKLSTLHWGGDEEEGVV